jgi:hypothetical protein
MQGQEIATRSLASLRYLHDARFHRLVDSIADVLRRQSISEGEMLEAVDLARKIVREER